MAVVINGSGTITGVPGAVLQVVNVTNSTQATTTSTSMVSTGVSASITPTSSTSKILVRITAALGSTSVGGVGFSLARNSTVIWNPSQNDGSGYYSIYSTASWRGFGATEYLDSPATTSSTTYAIYYAARANTAVINETGSTNNGGSTITLMEIAA